MAFYAARFVIALSSLHTWGTVSVGGASPTDCETLIPSLSNLSYRFTGQQRHISRGAGARSTSDVQIAGTVLAYDQSGLLLSLAIAVDGLHGKQDAYYFVCAFADDQPLTATCTLTQEDPARPQGPALVTARFQDVKTSGQGCVPHSIRLIGSYPFSSVTDDAGIYSMNALLEASQDDLLEVQGSEGRVNVLIVYDPDEYGQVQQLANAVRDGAAVVATVRLLQVSDANYERDVVHWADAVILGSGVYNGNAAPTLLEFINSFDFQVSLVNKTGGSFATAGGPVAGLDLTIEELSRGLRTFGVLTLGGTTWENAHGTGIVTSGSKSLSASDLALGRDQGLRIASVALALKATFPPAPPRPSIPDPPVWGESWTALVEANMTQVGYDAGLVMVNFTGHCSDPSKQSMRTVYGDFDTVLTRCDLGLEFVINPPSRGGACTTRVIGKDADPRICEACSCPFCVRDTNGSFTHGQQYPSKTHWTEKQDLRIMDVDVSVWRGKALSKDSNYALFTSIAYTRDSLVPVFVNVSHPLWIQTAAHIQGFKKEIDFRVFDVPRSCYRSQEVTI